MKLNAFAKPLTPGKRSYAAYLLLRKNIRPSDIIGCTGKSATSISHWLSGKRTPDADSRLKIFKRWADIVPHYWDIAPPVPGAEIPKPLHLSQPQAPAPVPVHATPVTPADEARLLVDQARTLREQVLKDTDATPAERLKILTEAAKVLHMAGRLTGDGHDVNEARILRSPQWQRIKERTIEALKSHPEALQAFAEVCESLG